jgi:hypothetical protein
LPSWILTSEITVLRQRLLAFGDQQLPLGCDRRGPLPHDLAEDREVVITLHGEALTVKQLSA